MVCGSVAGVQINSVKPAPEIAALKLCDARRVVINGGCVVRRGDKRFAARGGKGVLIRQPEAVGGNVHGPNA